MRSRLTLAKIVLVSFLVLLAIGLGILYVVSGSATGRFPRSKPVATKPQPVNAQLESEAAPLSTQTPVGSPSTDSNSSNKSTAPAGPNSSSDNNSQKPETAADNAEDNSGPDSNHLLNNLTRQVKNATSQLL